MIYNVKGKLTYVDPAFVVIECGGVGFKCFASMTTISALPSVGNEVSLYTHMAVREDAIDLYGFYDSSELDAFKLLITVSGIGPKAAMSILSVLPPDRLSIAVSSGDVKSITAANGIGKKTAERVVLELKDKMVGIASPSASATVENIVNTAKSSNASEAVEVLISLGFERSDAAAAVGSLDSSLSVDDMIRKGLKQLSANL
ncbi:MAG: Holliday junction branch migration protein RuvA [Eubacterium sp.]|nr:Holliday junction branch migration protein RuvA [Eubacterium sp.]